MSTMPSDRTTVAGRDERPILRRRWSAIIGLLAVGLLGSPAQAHVGPNALDCYQPDGWIRVVSNHYVGNDIYNRTGQGQSRLAAASAGDSVTFGILIQNDDPSPTRFLVKGKASADGYKVRYLHDGSDVTSAITAGTYKTPKLGHTTKSDVILAKVKVTHNAAPGSELSRLVRITWYSWQTTWCQDAVRYTAKRA
jgi:hypothetical protein